MSKCVFVCACASVCLCVSVCVSFWVLVSVCLCLCVFVCVFVLFCWEGGSIEGLGSSKGSRGCIGFNFRVKEFRLQGVRQISLWVGFRASGI